MMPMSGTPRATDPGAGSPESGGARHAALLLHAMAPVDRTWVLDALPPAERAGLLRLLAELEALGIERDPALIAHATSNAPPVDALQSMPMSGEARLRALDEAQVGEFIRIMRTESAELIAEWLRLAEWPWRENLLAALEPGQRRKVEANLAITVAGYQTPPALRAALITAAAARLRDPARAAGAVPKTPWHKLKHSFDRALRGARSPSRGAR